MRCRIAALVSLLALASLGSAQDAPRGQPLPLFDGKTLNGWTTQDGKPVTQGWEALDGMIHLKKEGKRSGHIITSYDIGDFVLTFDWKIATGGNSGLKYRVRKYGKQMLGCEYQIFDDEGARRKPAPKNSAGSLYDLYEPNDKKHLKPAGEFNTARIVVQGSRIEHWLNGHLIVSATVGDPEWQRRIARSKFTKNEGFGQNRTGRIMLTDHGSEVWYRNIKLETLPTPETTIPTPR